MDLDTLTNEYLAAGGSRPATFLRGVADAGRFGLRGELARVTDEQADDYAAGVNAAATARELPEAPWVALNEPTGSP